MQPSFMTGTYYRENALNRLPQIREAGFRAIEVWCYEPHFLYQSAAFLREFDRARQGLGIEVIALHIPWRGDMDLSGRDPICLAHARETALRMGEILSSLGGRFLVAHAGGRVRRGEKTADRLSICLESMAWLLDALSPLGITVAVENTLGDHLGGNPETLRAIFDTFPRNGVGLCLDTYHAHLTGTMGRILSEFGSRILHLHVSDTRGRRDDHLPPTEGIIDWRRLIRGLREAGYGGRFNLEVMQTARRADMERLPEVVMERAREVLGGDAP